MPLIDIEYGGKVRRENRATSLRAEREGQGIDPSMNYSVKTLAVSNTANLKWRAMTAADLAAIQQLADTQHVYLPERPEVFAEKFELFSRRMTYPLWTRFGCEIVSDAALADHLKSCGDTACYLIRAAVESAL